jgi:hypothetical protein
VQNDPVISMDVLRSSVNKCTDILNDRSADKSAIANDCSSLDAFEVREHFVRAVVFGPDTEVKSVVIPLCASECQMDIHKLEGNLLSDESACVSSDVVVNGVEIVVEDISRVLFRDGHLSSEIIASSTRIDSSCDLKFPQNLIITGSLSVDASTNVVNVGVPLLGVVVEEHHLLTDKECLERENNSMLFKAKLDGKSFFQYARKIVSATCNYLFQVLDVLHLSVRLSHASGLADDVMGDLNAVYLNNIYKDFVVMIEPEPPPFILKEHAVPEYTAQTKVMKLLRITWFRDYTVDYVKVRDVLLKAVASFNPDYDIPWINRSDCSNIRAEALTIQERTDENGVVSESIINKACKKFSGSTKKWTPSKKEAFGVYFGTKSFKYFLEGSELFQLNG